MRGKILVVDHRTPTPDQDSGSASTLSYLQILSQSGFQVTFAPQNLKRAGRYTRDLEKLGIRALARPKWKSLAEVIRTFGPQSDILLLYRVGVASTIFDLAKEMAPQAKIIFHAVDLHFLRVQRQAEVTRDSEGRAQAIADLRNAELDLMKRADAAIVVSAKEYDLIRELVPEANVHHIPILRRSPDPPSRSSWLLQKIAPAGFRRRIAKLLGRAPPALADRRDFLFIGGFEHTPNVDAVIWFVRNVWPEVLSRGFPHNFIIVGSKVPPQVIDLASDRIEVRGYVKDLTPLFAKCRLSIAPLRYGGGIKGKIVTSLSLGLPVVATSIAAEGMNLRHGENILIADTPAAMAEEILRIYSDDPLWLTISANGRKAFEARFSHSSGAPKVLALIDSLCTAKSVAPRHAEI
jgi:O-antigen biosynthesis protein